MSARDVRARRAVLVLCTALTATVVAACSSGSTGAATSTASGSASYEELTQAFLAYAQCARVHGMPDLPDPVVDQQGNDSYPPLATHGSPHWPSSVLSGCASVWDHVHAVRARYDASHGLAARAQNDMTAAQQLAFSRCVRLHGFPTYPDPAPDGSVAEQPPGFQKPNLSEAAKAAILACDPRTSHG